MTACRAMNVGFTIPNVVSWVVAGLIVIAFISQLRTPSKPDVRGVDVTPADPPQQTVSESVPRGVRANIPPVLSDLKMQPGGPCAQMPGTAQIIANVCDDGNGSFFVRLNPEDHKHVRIAHLMERVRSYKLDFKDRRVLSVVPVTETVCIDDRCEILVYGAYGYYEFLK